MPAVSKTSPILNLAIVGYLHLLQEQFETILVPKAVINELRIQENLPGSSEVRKAVENGWIRVIDVKDKEKVKLLNRELDRGESEAIALTLQERADWILVDERGARRICK